MRQVIVRGPRTPLDEEQVGGAVTVEVPDTDGLGTEVAHIDEADEMGGAWEGLREPAALAAWMVETAGMRQTALIVDRWETGGLS